MPQEAVSRRASGPDHELLTTIIAATDAVILVVDTALVVRAFNSAAERLFDRRAPDIVGKSASVLFAAGADAASQADAWLTTPGSHRAVPRQGDNVSAPVDASVSEITVAGEQLFVVTFNADPRALDPFAVPGSEMFRAAIEAMDDAVVVVHDGARVYVNLAFVHLFGYATRTEALAEALHGRWHPEDAAAREAKNPSAGPLSVHRVLRPDGAVRLVEGARADITFEGASATLLVLRDVTHREQTIRSFAEGEPGFWPMFERLPVGVAIVDRDRNVIEANQAFARMVHETPEALKGTLVSRAFPSDSQRASRPGSYERVMSGELNIVVSERDVIDPNLEASRVRVTTFPVPDSDGRVLYTVQTIEDISSRVAAEQALQESEALFWQTFEHASVGMAIAGIDRNIVHANAALATMLGAEGEALAGTWFGRSFPPETLGRKGGIWEQLVAGDITYFEDEREVVAPGAVAQWVSVATSSVTDQNGQMRYAVRIVQDITQRKRAEAELRDSEAEYRQLFEAAPFAIAVLGVDGNITSVNGAMERLLGRSAAGLMGTALVTLHPSDFVREKSALLARVLDGTLDMYQFECPFQRTDGSVVWTIGRTSPLRDAEGNVKAAMVILEDVTERRRVEEAVRESGARFRALFDEAPFAIALVSPAEGIVETNRALQQMLGFSHDEMRGSLLRDFLSPAFESRGQGNMARALAGEIEHDEQEWMYRRKDGVDVWARGRTSVLRDAHGEVEYVQLMLEDITERRRAEDEVRASERRFRSLFEVGPSGIVLIDRDRKVFAANPEMERLLGRTAEELIGSGLRTYFSPDAPAPDRAKVDAVLNGELASYTVETLFRRKDGTDVWTRSIVSPVRDEAGNVEFGMIITEDIDARRRAELDLVDSEERFRILFDSAPLGIVLKDVDNRIIMANEAMEEITGRSTESLKGQTLGDFVSARTTVRDEHRHDALVAGQLDESRRERWLTRPDGSETLVSSIESAVRDSSGVFRYSVMTFEDVTDERRAVAELSASESRFRAIFESAGLGIVLTDPHGKMIDLNAEFEAMFGYERDELVGRQLREFRAIPLVSENSLGTRSVRESGVDRLASERLYRRKDGSEFPALVNTAAVRDEAGALLYSVRTVTDITARMEIERGKDEFLAMTSHELRTPVTSLHAAVTLVAQGVFGPVSEKAQEMLDIASSNSERLVALVNDLIDLERLSLGKISMSFAPVDAQALAQEAADLVRPLADAAGVQIDVRAEEATFVGDSGRLLQTLQNLLANAIKFSPAGSTVRLESVASGSSVQFTVADRGRGIPQDQLESIFESFQQVDSSDTRDPGGSGLGLAIAKAIVERHHGRIVAESELGKGSTFRVELPLAGPAG